MVIKELKSLVSDSLKYLGLDIFKMELMEDSFGQKIYLSLGYQIEAHNEIQDSD